MTNDLIAFRELSMDDDKEIFMLRSDDYVNRYLDRPRASSIEDARIFIKKIMDGVAEGKSVYKVITSADSNEFLGTICLWGFDSERLQMEIGYELLPVHEGKGIMREALSKMIEHAFRVMGLRRIVAGLHRDNKRSIRLLEKNGFLKESEDGNIVEYVLQSA